MIRLGLIGAGPWGQRYIKTLEALPGLTLACVASRSAGAKSLVGERCKVFPDWMDLLASDLDGVIIATPPSLHAEMASAALEAGLPVLIEKPLTLDLAQAKKLLALAQKREGFVLTGHTHLFSAAYAALRAKAAELGRLLSLRTEGGNKGPFRQDTSALWDYGPHDVSFCLDLAGEKPVSAAGRREEKTAQGENLRLALGFREGLSAEIHIGNLFPAKRRVFEARCEGGTLRIDDLKEDKLVFRPLKGAAVPLPLEPGLPLERQLLAFASAIAKESKDLSSLRLGVAVVDVLAKVGSHLTSSLSRKK